MTRQNEIRIPFSDLLNLVLECKCGTEVTIDFTKDVVLKADWESKVFRCPVCNNQFDGNLRLGFENFIGWQERVKASGQTVFFRIRNPN